MSDAEWEQELIDDVARLTDKIDRLTAENALLCQDKGLMEDQMAHLTAGNAALAGENERLEAKVESLTALAVRRRTALNRAKADNHLLAVANRDLICRIYFPEGPQPGPSPETSDVDGGAE